jgi:acyl-CoA hydrolase/GNAT superfamily N-acetyltransferase
MEIQTEDNEIYHLFSFGPAPYVRDQFTKRFRYNSMFISNNIRRAVNQGLADYTPVSSRKIPDLFRKKLLPIDIALIQTSVPDQSGYVSLGISVDVTKAAVENAEIVIAEINSEMPVTHGNSFIHTSQIDFMVENTSPMIEWIPTPVTERTEKVAHNVASLVEDESTLQIGVGNVASIFPKYLSDKKDLGIHSELISDSTLELIESGVITNAKKTIHEGKTVGTFCMGTQKLYNTINDNPDFAFYPSDYVLDTSVVEKNYKMTTINSCLEIDLTGQVAADSLGTYLYSGIGGVLDIHRGAQRSKGGKTIIALPSTSKNDKHSKIVAYLTPGTGVGITRADIEYVVTEYGIAYLHGATLRERVLAMIELAHPKFREELTRQAKELNYCYQDQIYSDPSKHLLYPLEVQESFTLKNGPTVRVRPILSSDENKLRRFFYSVSEKSRYSRYFSAIRSMPHALAQKEANINFSQDMGIAAFLGPISKERIIGTGHFFLLHDFETAEVSLLVHEDFRNKGLARFFLYYLTKRAIELDIKRFITETIMGNAAAIHLLRDFADSGLATQASMESEGGVVILTWEFTKESFQKGADSLFQ